MAIRDWPRGERPREKLIAGGAASLSDAELLAIFIRTGLRGKSAVDLARDLINTFGSLRGLLQADRKSFCRNPGLGDAKYAQLQAVLEMAGRHLRESLQKGGTLTSPQETQQYLLLRMRDYQQEVFGCLFLDNKHRIIAFEEMFRGTIDGASVYPREIVRRGLQHNAAALILAHNHPSGDPEPSAADRAITAKIKAALALVDIRVLDHCVVGDNSCVSFAERGII
ncbi:MAG TPA: DNA repair protein RadC [Gammaproteobacteria bacterium]